MSAIVVVGGGAAGTCLVTRICAGAPRLGGVLDLHVVDPYPPGAGRTWRGGAARADSAAGDLTAFPDGAGPSLADWLGREPGHLARRSEVGDYLADAFGRAARGAPPNVRVHAHRARAVGLDESAPAGRQRVRLSDGGTLTADAVVLAHGRPAAPPTDEEAAEAVFADRHGLVHLPGGHAPADDVPDLELLRAGEPVLVHGSGRAFTDLTALLTTGRGGRFAERGRGETVYLPSGDEPLLHVTSHAG
ncbi:FAD/NAD(P)-binding protein, partial [Nonomuraea sp. NPDC004297]